MEPLISVIVPVYNVEKYLKKCVESIIRQTYKNIEIILVDDGSTDNSGKICDELKSKDERIKVFHKKNGGLSDARNYGIERMSGKWVTFIDSDDYIFSKYIEKLYSILESNKAEISICDPVHVFGENKPEFKEETNIIIYNSLGAIQTMWYQTSFLPSAWGKLYKSDIFKNLRFTKGIIFEDIDIMHEIFMKANKIVYSTAQYYAYVHRENSITTQKFSEKDLYILNVCEKIEKFALKEGNKDLINASIAYSVVGNMRVYLNVPRNNKEYISYIKNAEEYIKLNGKSVLKDKNVRKKTKVGLILFYISKKGMKIIHSKVNRWK